MSNDYMYAKRWRMERARGIKRTTPATKTSEHVDALRKAGWSYRGIAEASGVPVQTVNRVHRGMQHNVATATERKVLALKADDIFTRPNRDGFVPNIGARRRLQALMAIGWRHQDITPILGSQSTNLLHQIGDWISREKHDAMVRVYNQLWDQPGPSQKARNHAAKMGWPAPLAWDDETIDDPNAAPADLNAPGKGERRESTAHAFIEDVEFLIRTGATFDEIGERLGGGDGASVERRLYRHGRSDLISRQRIEAA